MLLREINPVRTNVPAVEQPQRIRAIELGIVIDEPFRRHVHRLINIKAYWTKTSRVVYVMRAASTIRSRQAIDYRDPRSTKHRLLTERSYSNYSHSGEAKLECVIKDDP